MVASLNIDAAEFFAKAVKDLRERQGLTQRDLAKAIGREQNFVARIETRQRRVDLIEWLFICRACGIDPTKETLRIVRELLPILPNKLPRK